MPARGKKKRVPLDDPVMSDVTILMSVEDLINIALGSSEVNTVNYKMLQTILHILARQLRMLQTKVNIRYGDVTTKRKKKDHSEVASSPPSPRSEVEDIEEKRKKKKGGKSPRSKEGKAQRTGEVNESDALEREKARKELDKEKEALGKMTDAEKERYFKQKEREALEKMTPKVRERYLKEREEEEEALRNMTPEEREAYKKEKQELAKMTPEERERFLKLKKAKSTASETSISISEMEHDNEKVLIVERGPSTRAESKSRSSIEVVTASRFNLLEQQVAGLRRLAAPPPLPALPADSRLRAELARGTASLTDIMQAMQVAARVQAAEEGVSRMAGLLTQLAASGALPAHFAALIEQSQADLDLLTADMKGEARPAKFEASKRKSVAIDASSGMSRFDRLDSESSVAVGTGPRGGTRPSLAASRVSRLSQSGAPALPVTKMELDAAIQSLRDELVLSMQQLSSRAAATAESAALTTKGVEDKLNMALGINARISELFMLTADYADQLSGFDAGLTSQMQGFQEQIAQMKEDLKAGLGTLGAASNNAETAAVEELTQRYTALAEELDSSAAQHQHLTLVQKQLADDIRGLVAAVETIQEQKADRDEVWDGLRDKADMCKLEGLVTEQVFAAARAELEERMQLCYVKFGKQEAAWMQALQDLGEVAATKAPGLQLMSMRSEVQDQLNQLHEKLKLLELQLGEPKAAVLTRLLSKDGQCGVCRAPALMEGGGAPLPPALPPLRPPPSGAPSVPPVYVVEDDADKCHVCRRWVGGSHTLVSRRRTPPAPHVEIQPAHKYVGMGSDGRMYNMAEELVGECECSNQYTDEVDDVIAGGDGDIECSCAEVTKTECKIIQL